LHVPFLYVSPEEKFDFSRTCIYICGGTPKIIKILVVVPQIIDGVLTPPGIFS
jgi:hypothetical protein